MEVRNHRFGDALFGFVHALLRTTGIWYLAREQVRSTFLEDFRAFTTDHIPSDGLTFGWHRVIRHSKGVGQGRRFSGQTDPGQVGTDGVNKESLHKAGLQFPDGITFLGSLTGAPVRSVVTWNGIYRTSVTGHVRLRHVADLVTRERVSRAISDLWDAMGRLGVAPRRIGVAALNPHGARGEGGAFGDEEIRHITPAVEAAVESRLAGQAQCTSRLQDYLSILAKEVRGN